MKYKGLLFDVDGVLVNSEKLRIDYFFKTFETRALPIPNDFSSQILGKSTPVLLQELVAKHNLDQNTANELLENYNKEIKQNYPLNVVPIAETVNFILTYSGDSTIGIATVNTRDKVLKVLSYLNLTNLVKAVVSRDDITNQKPNPEVYIHLAKILGLKPSECAVIEDTAAGAQAGINAGMDCYIFLNSYNDKAQFTDLDIKGYILTTDDLSTIAL